jgi:hypothetical protein
MGPTADRICISGFELGGEETQSQLLAEQLREQNLNVQDRFGQSEERSLDVYKGRLRSLFSSPHVSRWYPFVSLPLLFFSSPSQCVLHRRGLPFALAPSEFRNSLGVAGPRG